MNQSINQSLPDTATLKHLAAAYLIPALLTRVKLRWIAFGAVAYYGLKMLNERGALPAQAEQAFKAVDRGIDAAKEKIGFKKSEITAGSSSPVH